MLTVKQVSQRLNVSQGLIYRAVSNGELSHYRFGSAIRISELQLSEWLNHIVTTANEANPKQSFSHLDL